MEINKIILEIKELREAEKNYAERRAFLEKRISAYYNIELGKSKTIHTGEYKISVKSPIIRSLNKEQIPIYYNQLPYKIQSSLFTVTYRLKEAGFKELEESHKELFKQLSYLVTTKPGKIAVTVC